MCDLKYILHRLRYRQVYILRKQDRFVLSCMLLNYQQIFNRASVMKWKAKVLRLGLSSTEIHCLVFYNRFAQRSAQCFAFR